VVAISWFISSNVIKKNAVFPDPPALKASEKRRQKNIIRISYAGIIQIRFKGILSAPIPVDDRIGAPRTTSFQRTLPLTPEG
jgi:hypothetical protein